MKREKVKAVAVAMVRESGLINLSRRELCEQADIPDGSFPHIMECNFSQFVEELRAMNIEENARACVSKSRVPAAMRKEHILGVAIELAIRDGYNKITRDGIAEAAGVSMGLVTKYFGTMIQLKRDVIRAAIKQEIPEIIAQGLANGDDRARKASAELKAKAATILASL